MSRNYKIAIIAPCPIGLEIENGWFDRIKVIDDLVVDQPRIYFRVCPDNEKPIGDSIINHNDLATEAFVNFNKQDHLDFVAEQIGQVNLLYVHTLHYAEYALPYLESGKVIVDIHGVTPEEETMMGQPDLAPKYEEIEQEVLKKALRCVMVTQSMVEHYKIKYPDIQSRNMILPIVQHYGERKLREPHGVKAELPIGVIYAGGLQAWQQVPKMLDIAANTSAFAKYTFLSAEWEKLKDEASEKHPNLDAKFGYANKTELSSYYEAADFGFILREDCAVNRVACPTKLFDYMWHGVIPITDTPHLGDFEVYGYAYISADDFLDGFFPDHNSRLWMQENNREVVAQMSAGFLLASQEIKNFLTQNARTSS